MRKTASVPNFSQVIFKINSQSLHSGWQLMLHKFVKRKHDCKSSTLIAFPLYPLYFSLNSCTNFYSNVKAVKEAAQNGGVSTQKFTTIFEFISSSVYKFSHIFYVELSLLISNWIFQIVETFKSFSKHLELFPTTDYALRYFNGVSYWNWTFRVICRLE